VPRTHFIIFTWGFTVLLPTLNLFTLILYFHLLLVVLGTKIEILLLQKILKESVVLKSTV